MSAGFLRPTDDDFAPTWTEDKVDIEPSKETTFVYNPNANWNLAAQRKRLPITKNRDHLLYLLENNQVVVVVGETGSGKSTQIPQFLVEAGWAKQEGIMIGITEPRRVAVTTLATRVAEEQNTQLGRRVGYSIRFDECFLRNQTKIKYMTEGILIREMMEDPLLKSYSVIILDEAHERTAQTDIIMGLLKKVLRKRRDLRLIVSSATVDAEYIRDFFTDEESLQGKAEGKEPCKQGSAAILSVEGTSYSVDVFYLKDPCPNYVQACVDTVIKIHQHESLGDILVFLTGMEEVDQCVKLLKEQSRNLEAKTGCTLYPLPMYGSLTQHDQLKAFRQSPRGQRKVVVATNIAETSITIDGIAYVVDSCFVKMRWFNPDTNVDSLIISEVSQASAQQRTGRAGRTRPGQCYRMCTEDDFKSLPLNTLPEMQRTDLSNSVLMLKALGIDNLVRFEFPSSPPSKNLIASLEVLYALGALDDAGKLTKPLGEQMAEFPIHPSLSKMLLTSGEFGCSREIAIVVAMLQIEDVFIVPRGETGNKARMKHRDYQTMEGDLLTLLNVFLCYRFQLENYPANIKHYCSSHFIKYKALKRADQLFERLSKTLGRFGIKVGRHTQVPDTAFTELKRQENIRKCVVSGMFPNAAYYHPSGAYRTVRSELDLHVHPKSVLYTLKPPLWVVFSELQHTNKVYMKDITVIEPEWLETLAPHFYEKKTVQTVTGNF